MIQACDKFRVMTQRVRVWIQDRNYLLLWGYKVTEPREALEVSARTLLELLCMTNWEEP